MQNIPTPSEAFLASRTQSNNSAMLGSGIADMLQNAFRGASGIPEAINGVPKVPQASSSNNSISVRTSNKIVWEFVQSGKGNTYGQQRYVVRIILDKHDPSVSSVKNAIASAFKEGAKRFGADFEETAMNPLHDGDKELPQNGRIEKYRGKYYMYGRSSVPPIVLNDEGVLIQDSLGCRASSPLTRCEGAAFVEFFPYTSNRNGNTVKGVGCSLNALMMIENKSHPTGDKAEEYAQNIFSDYIQK